MALRVYCGSLSVTQDSQPLCGCPPAISVSLNAQSQRWWCAPNTPGHTWSHLLYFLVVIVNPWASSNACDL